MRLSVYLLLFYIIYGVVAVSAVHAAETVDDIERLRANVLALDRIQKNIHQDIASRTVTDAISQQESTELQVFASYLQDRNREDCTRLIDLAGPSAVTDLPCPAQKAQLPETKIRTVAEEMSELDRMLAESLGDFDEMLLKEQEMVAARQPRERESGAGGSGASGNAGQAGKSGAAKSRGSGQQGAGTGKDHSRSAAAAGKPGSAAGQTGNIKRPSAGSLNTDDDIVARQLREAAEKETDPELKEKLWDEYRKYKTGQ